jgi:hypothetical protein
MSFPKRMDLYDVQTRLSKLGADPEDLKVVGAALQAGLQTRDTIEKQRDELARLHKERESAWQSDGCQTHWAHLPTGQLIITVFLGRTVAGVVTRLPVDSQYTWVSGRFNGVERGIYSCLREIERAYAKRAKVKIDLTVGRVG